MRNLFCFGCYIRINFEIYLNTQGCQYAVSLFHLLSLLDILKRLFQTAYKYKNPSSNGIFSNIIFLNYILQYFRFVEEFSKMSKPTTPEVKESEQLMVNLLVF